MATSSNQSLWLLVTGRTIQEPLLLQRELENNEERLSAGVVYYKPASSSSAGEVKKKSKGKELDIVLQISKLLDLDELLSLELFQHFILEAYRGSFKDIKTKVNGVRETQEFLHDVFLFYCSERLYLLRILKHIYGHWQDGANPYQEIFQNCCEAIIDNLTRENHYEQQYKSLYNTVIPGKMSLSADQENLWALQNLKEQIEVLEVCFLFYKDFLHPADRLLECTKMFKQHNYGIRQLNKHLIGVHGNHLLSQISHLQALILLEGVCLEWLQHYQLNPDMMQNKTHHLLKENAKKPFKELCSMSSSGLSQHISPMLLALALLHFHFPLSPTEDAQVARKLGNVSLQAGVFAYLLEILQCDKFKGDSPIASTCQIVIHTLMMVTLEVFDEQSLGDSEAISSVVAMVMAHPLLRAEFWEKDPTGGVGSLLLSHQSKFPFELGTFLELLKSLSQDQSSAVSVYGFLGVVPYYSEEFNLTNELAADHEHENGWIRISATSPFVGLEIPAGTRGQVSRLSKDVEIISWNVQYSAFSYFLHEAAVVCRSTDSGDTWCYHANNVIVTAKLVASLIQHNSTLVDKLQPIIMQYLAIIERFSNYPNPSMDLLSSCLRVIVATMASEPSKMWKMLLQTGFPPYLVSLSRETENISVVPGCYGKLMGMWECPRGVYPVTMVFLDMLLALIKAQWEEKWNSHDLLAGVCLTAQDIYSNQRKWRFTSVYDQQLIGYKCLQLFHTILNDAPSTSPFLSYTVHCLHHMTTSEVLLDSISVTMGTIQSLSDYPKLHDLFVNKLKLSFKVITLLLSQPKENDEASFQKLLASHFSSKPAPSSQSVMFHVVSFIHFSCDPQLPCVVTKLLKQLCEVAPMSLFSMLGSHGIAVRDAFVRRLSAKTEDVDLKVSILDFVTIAIETQPALTELFLCLKPFNDSSRAEVYELDDASCMVPVLDMLDSQNKEVFCPPKLLCAATRLIHAVWKERKVTAMAAMGRSDDFWKHLLQPLFCDVDLEPNREEIVHELETCAHIINTVALEAFNTLEKKMDTYLSSLLDDFAKQGYYHIWTQNLKSLEDHDVMENIEPIPVAVVTAQLELVRSWSTLLLVATGCHEGVFHLTEKKTRDKLLTDIVSVMKSQLSAVYSPQLRILITTELSVLYMILLRKWMSSLSPQEGMVKNFCDVLELASNLGHNSATHHLNAHLFAAAHMILKVAPPSESSLFVPFISGVIQKYPESEEHFKMHTLALGVLQEIITMITEHTHWLPQLRKHTTVQLLVHYLRSNLQQSDRNIPFIQSILGVLHAIAASKVANVLIHCGLMDVLCLCLSGGDTCHVMWRDVIQLVTTLLVTMKHAFVPHAVDFVGVHVETIISSLDLLESIKSWDQMQMMVAVVMFVNHLSHYRRQWQLSLPQLHSVVIEKVLELCSCCVASLSKEGVMKHIVKSLQASGEPAIELKPCKSPTASEGAAPADSLLEELLINTLSGCLGALYHHCPDLASILQDTTLFDLADYPPLVALGFSQPSLQAANQLTDLGTLTASLSLLVRLLNKTSAGHFKSPSKSPSKYPEDILQKRLQLFWVMEQVVLLLLSQAVRYLIDPTIDDHSKQLLKRELSSELGNFLSALLRHFTRKGAPSPLSARSRVAGYSAGTLLSHDASSSRTSSLSFTDSEEQAVFRLADSFVKQFLQ